MKPSKSPKTMDISVNLLGLLIRLFLGLMRVTNEVFLIVSLLGLLDVFFVGFLVVFFSVFFVIFLYFLLTFKHATKVHN